VEDRWYFIAGSKFEHNDYTILNINRPVGSYGRPPTDIRFGRDIQGRTRPRGDWRCNSDLAMVLA
jgi:hypothetical protein